MQFSGLNKIQSTYRLYMGQA